MSYSLENIYAALPRTTRGAFTVLGADPKGKSYLYVNGNSVFIRSVENPFECDVYTEHAHPVQVAKYAPSGFYIASADQTGKVRIWDTTNKEHLLKNEFQPLSGCIKDLQWSGDSQRLLVGGEGREKYGHVFNADTGTSVGEIMGTSKPINSVDFKATRPFRAVVASEDNSICYFEGPPFKWKKTLNEHDRFVNVVRFAPNGERFASGGADGKLVIFDGKTGDKLDEITSNGTHPAHQGSIYSLCWDPTSQLILTVSGDKTAKLWNAEQKTLIREYKFGDSLDDQQVGCLWINSNLLTVSLSGNINYLNHISTPGENVVLKTITGHSKSITALEVVSGERALIVSGSHDGQLICWSALQGHMQLVKASAAVGAHKNQVQAVRHDPVNDQLVTCGLDDTVKFVDLAECKYIHEVKLDSQPQGLDVDLSGLIVVVCINQLLTIRNKQVVKSVKLGYEATSVAVTRKGGLIAVGGRDNKVHVYDAGELAEQIALTERDFITSVRFANDDKYLAVADNAKNVKCYALDTAAPTAAASYADVTRGLWQHHAGKITSLAWSPDSTCLATSSVDTHCFIYSPSNVSSYVHIKNAHPLNPLTACAWLENARLITASQDCCLRKWKINANFAAK